MGVPEADVTAFMEWSLLPDELVRPSGRTDTTLATSLPECLRNMVKYTLLDPLASHQVEGQRFKTHLPRLPLFGRGVVVRQRQRQRTDRDLPDHPGGCQPIGQPYPRGQGGGSPAQVL